MVAQGNSPRGRAPGERLSWPRGAVGLVLIAWFLAMSAVGTSYAARHAPLPLGPLAAKQLSALDDQAGARVVHVLLASCRCSRRVLERLVLQGPATGARERVVLVDGGDADAARLAAAGFAVTRATGTELAARFSVAVSPLLVVFDAAGSLAYAGGYATSKQSVDLRHRDLVAATLRGERPTPLPVYGCAVSGDLRAITRLGGLL